MQCQGLKVVCNLLENFLAYAMKEPMIKVSDASLPKTNLKKVIMCVWLEASFMELLDASQLSIIYVISNCLNSVKYCLIMRHFEGKFITIITYK